MFNFNPWRCLLLGLLFVSTGSQAQTDNLDLALQLSQDASNVSYPYNPDVDATNTIGASDLIEFLLYFGNPNGFQIESTQEATDLSQVIQLLATLIVAQQAEIDALQGQLQTQNQALENFAPLLGLVPVAERSVFGEDTWTLSGINVRLDNGSGTTYGTSNGLGNLILGYHESEGGHRDPEGNYMDGEVRTGSHNLVVGAGHTFGSNGGILGGYNNSLFGQGASIVAGQASLATGTWSSILGGLDNRTTATSTCISGGHSNTASGDRASVSGGLLNVSAGIATSILGGQYMQISEQYETASGQYNINN